jgi:myo-inositol-1-phosphate synthase
LQTDIRNFARNKQLDQVVVINLASTEPQASSEAERLTGDDLTQALERSEANTLPTSSWVAYAAIDAGFPYVNFTASAGADLSVLAQLAQHRRVPIAGSDGKTGETLVRTILAPMFYQRNLRVLSWVGNNLLGNRDGKVLSEPRNRESKLRAKEEALTKLLGYSPQTLTSIDHVDSFDDWKTAWDHVHFQGFLGVQMAMQFTWQGCDSALAAPLVIDLARLLLAAQRNGRVGAVEELSVFFKRPTGNAPHDLAGQFERLKSFANSLSRRS